MHRIDDGLKSLIEQARSQGHLTFQQVDDYLPDEGGDPSSVDHLVLALEECGLDVIEDRPAVVPRKKPAPAPANGTHSLGTPFVPPETSALSSRDPIRMYLSHTGTRLTITFEQNRQASVPIDR